MTKSRMMIVAEFTAIQLSKAMEDYERVGTEEARAALKPLLKILVFSMNESELNSKLQLPLSVTENGDAIKKAANEFGCKKVSSFVDSEDFKTCLANARRDAGIPATDVEGGASAGAAAAGAAATRK